MTITVKLPSELEQALRQQCAAEGRSLSEIGRASCRERVYSGV